MTNQLSEKLGKYKIIEEVGRGGFAVVYKAVDTTLDRTVALKCLAPHLLWDPTFVQRFQREAKVAANLDHSNIITIYEVSQLEGVYFIAMQFLEGRTVSQILEAEGRLPISRVQAIIEQVAFALDYAHARGFIHRDVKPSNIIVASDGKVTLTDFGLVKAGEGTKLSTTGVIFGTPEYMSPEQVQGKKLDAQSDVYSLGVVLYEMLAGRAPFVADTALSVMYKHVHDSPSLDELPPDLPQDIVAVVEKVLAKEREERFASAGALAVALKRAVRETLVEEVKAPPELALHPSLALQLSVKPQTVDVGGEAKWTVALRNDGDDDLRHVTVRRGRTLLDEPFDLAAGKGRRFAFTTTYKTEGKKTEKVTATGIASTGESVRDEASATVEVIPTPPEPVPTPAPQPTLTPPHRVPKPVARPKPKAPPRPVTEKAPAWSTGLVIFAVLIFAGIAAIGLAGFSVGLLIIAVSVTVLGYWFYGKRVDRNIIQPDPGKATPAKMYMDGVDFTPASRNVLFGYQFKSIAALAPITGPIIAVQWGWLPALIWIFLGTFFIGWVQDYGALIMGVRREGDTMGALSYKLISPRARNILLIFVYFYLLLIMGAFGNAVGKVLMTNPKVPFGMIALVLMGILAGQMTYKWKQDIILTTVVTVVLTFVGIWVSTLPFMSNIFAAIYALPYSPTIFLGNTQAQVLGTLLVIIFCYLGAARPIWSFAQPVNYVSFWIVSLGMMGGVIGLLIWRPGMGDFPAFTGFTTASGPLWPMLFVTIACGAISGWHSLVSTSSTARQLEKETDALPVGGGAMFMEMGFAVIAFLTATTAFGGWQGYQDAGGASLALGVFAGGLARFLGHIGVSETFGVAYGSVFLTIMALTVMPLAVRFMRVTSAELAGYALPVMRNVHVGSIVALLLTLLFVWVIPWLTIWAVFGAANQLMAGLALLLVSLWLMSEGRKHTWALYPAVFMILTSIAAALYVAYTHLVVKLPAAASVQASIAAILVGIIALVLVVAAAFLIVDGWQAIQRAGREEVAEA